MRDNILVVQGWDLETGRDEEGFLDRRFPLCRDEEDALHLLLKCFNTRK
jgi:hypothetical protein